MKQLLTCLSALGLAVGGGTFFAAAPASAQVNGIATSTPEAVFVRANARQNAYTAIQQQYAAQIQQIGTLRQELNTLQRSLDTNNDGQLTDQEIQANPNVVTQIQQKEQQIAQVSQPIIIAQHYVLEQLLQNYEAAQTQVVRDRNIQIMLTPEAIQYAPDQVNVTDAILAALNTRVPTVQTTPPANWQPRRETAALHQAVQQILLGVAQQQAIAAQQQAAQPAAPQQQPTGR